MNQSFYAQAVTSVAQELIGCVVTYGATSGRIVETEAYHQTEAASHSYCGVTLRNRLLFGPPGYLYIYQAYGIHLMLNVVAESKEIGAAVLLRALEPLEGVDLMEARRNTTSRKQLCSGPGKLAQALGIERSLNGTQEGKVLQITPRNASAPQIVAGPRIGISKAVELPWRYCEAENQYVSRPWIS